MLQPRRRRRPKLRKAFIKHELMKPLEMEGHISRENSSDRF